MDKNLQCRVVRVVRDGTRLNEGLGEGWPSVPPEEMAFAMAVFVGAGTCHFVARKPQPESAAWRLLSSELLTGLSPEKAEGGHTPPHMRAGQSSLEEAFFQVWAQYKGDPAQRSMCARVVGFHHLMVRTEGVATERWLTPSESDPESVTLHPAVVEALAAVKLSAFGLLPEVEFLADIVRMAARGVSWNVIAS